jgi:hypothetical protein
MSKHQQLIALDGATRLSLEMHSLDLSVRWSAEASSIAVTGGELRVDRAADEFFLRAEEDAPGTAIDIELPLAIMSVDTESETGDVYLDSPAGLVECSAGRGSVRSHGGSGSLRIAAGQGVASIDAFRGPVELSAGSGDVAIREIAGSLRLRAGTGDVRVESLSGGLISIAAGTGNVLLMECVTTACSIEAGTGDIHLDGGSAGEITVRAGSGGVTSHTGLGAQRHSIVTGAGAIDFGLPRGLNARIEASSQRGQIESQVPLVAVGQRGPRGSRPRRFVGSIGSGDQRADVSLRTASGDIQIRWLELNPPDLSTAGVALSSGSVAREVTDLEGDATRAVLEALARGDISVDEADRLLSRIADSDSD